MAHVQIRRSRLSSRLLLFYSEWARLIPNESYGQRFMSRNFACSAAILTLAWCWCLLFVPRLFHLRIALSFLWAYQCLIFSYMATGWLHSACIFSSMLSLPLATLQQHPTQEASDCDYLHPHNRPEPSQGNRAHCNCHVHSTDMKTFIMKLVVCKLACHRIISWWSSKMLTSLQPREACLHCAPELEGQSTHWSPGNSKLHQMHWFCLHEVFGPLYRPSWIDNNACGIRTTDLFCHNCWY